MTVIVAKHSEIKPPHAQTRRPLSTNTTSKTNTTSASRQTTSDNQAARFALMSGSTMVRTMPPRPQRRLPWPRVCRFFERFLVANAEIAAIALVVAVMLDFA
jgi:hypothetical protein